MRFWLIVHTHKYGNGFFAVESDQQPDMDLIERYGLEKLDYDPDDDREYLEVFPLEVIPLNDLKEELGE